MRSFDKLKTLIKVVTYHKELLPINSHDTLITFVLWGYTTNQIHYIFICRRSTGTAPGKVLTCHERLPHLKAHYAFIRWPTWGQVINWKKYISISQNLWLLYLAGWWLWGGGSDHKSFFCCFFFFVRAKSFNVRFCSSSNVYSLWGILVVLLCDIKVASFRMIC